MPKINGARGVILLGFGFLSLALGTGYFGGEWLGNFRIWPPIPPGLEVADAIFGLRFWGSLWLIVGLIQFFAAFRQDHSKALAGFTFMCFVWGASYASSFVMQLGEVGQSRLWLGAVAFFFMVIASLGVARLINAPPLNIDGLKEQIETIHTQERDLGLDSGD